MDQSSQKEFFAEATESQRYRLTEVIGKGSYGVVASAVDQFTGALSWFQACKPVQPASRYLTIQVLLDKLIVCRGEGGNQEDNKCI